MRIVVAGLGKTGTTALFFKLKAALREDALCLFEPRAVELPAGHAGDVLVKMLFGVNRPGDFEGVRGFDKKIVLVRDPRDTLVSRVLYDIYNDAAICADARNVEAFVDLLRRKEADPAGLPLGAVIDLYDRMARRPLLPRATGDPGAALEFQRRHAEYFPYRYEHLVRGDFRAIESCLGLPVGPGAAPVPAEFGRVARTKDAGDWRNWLTPGDVEFFKPHFAAYLAFNGYGADWTLPDRPHIRPEHGSEYVQKLVGERRRLSAS